MEQAAELNNLTFGVPSKGWALHGWTNWALRSPCPAEAGPRGAAYRDLGNFWSCKSSQSVEKASIYNSFAIINHIGLFKARKSRRTCHFNIDASELNLNM